MSLRGIFWKKHFFPVPAPAIRKQESPEPTWNGQNGI